MILSASTTVDSLCAIIIEVGPDISSFIVSCIILSLRLTSADVASANIDGLTGSICQAIAKKLMSRINRGKTRCFLTRRSDRFLGLNERAQFANSKGAEVFISLHVGNNDNIVIYAPFIAEAVPDMIKPLMVNRGQEEFMAESFILLESMRHAIASDFGNDMVQVKPLPYSLLSKVEAAAIMIEFPSFDDAYYGGEFRTDMVNTIHKGIYLYEEKTSRWD